MPSRWRLRRWIVAFCCIVIITETIVRVGARSKLDTDKERFAGPRKGQFPFRIASDRLSSNVTKQKLSTSAASSALDTNRAVPTIPALHWCNPEASRVFTDLSRPSTMVNTLRSLYSQYGRELSVIHLKLKSWCEQEKSCKFCDREAEMLYMQIREWKPERVFEMAPNRGYSTHFILEALKVNGRGHLDSFDLHSAADRAVVDDTLRAHWSFHMANVTEYVSVHPKMMKKYDFIFIDALHTVDFADWYTKALLSHAVECETPVIIHDIVANDGYSGRESMAVFAYMALSSDVGHAFTLNSAAGIPTPFSKVPGKHSNATYEGIRAEYHCGGNQKYFACNGLE